MLTQTPQAAHSQGRDAERIAVADELVSVLSRIRRANRHIGGGRPVELSSLTGAQLELVRQLRRHPGASVTEVASGLRLAPNTVSTLVGHLTQAGLVSRRADSSDKRVARLELAPDIRRKVDEWLDRRVVAVSTAVAGLSQEDQQCLRDAVEVMVKLAAQLEAQGDGR